MKMIKSIFRVQLLLMIFAAAVLLLQSCDPKTKLVQDIEELESEVVAAADTIEAMRPEYHAKLTELIQYYDEFLERYPGDALGDRFLNEKAAVQVRLLKFEDAVETLDRLIEEYPSSPFAPEALYYTAHIQEMFLMNYGAARERYKEFATTYPDHPNAEHIDLQIEYMGDPDGLLKAIREKTEEEAAK